MGPTPKTKELANAIAKTPQSLPFFAAALALDQEQPNVTPINHLFVPLLLELKQSHDKGYII